MAVIKLRDYSRLPFSDCQYTEVRSGSVASNPCFTVNFLFAEEIHS